MNRLAVAILFLSNLFAAPGDEFEALSVRDVKVGGEIGRRIDVTINNNLLVLDAGKDFIRPFQEKKLKDGYIGLGKLIHSAVRFAAYSNSEKVRAFKDDLVARTLATQESDGYIGILMPGSRVQALWDIHEIGYLVAGLTADYELFGNRKSLEGAQKAAGYVLSHWREIPPDWGARTDVATNVAVTGLERTMLALYRATRDARYLEFVTRERALAEWNLPVVVGRRAGIEGHIYAYMARTLAQLELFRLQPADGLFRQADRALEFLTRQDGMAITGGAGQWEIWTADQDGRGELAETCATAYLLRVLDNLLRMRGDSRYGDLMERVIYNTLFAAQSPDGRRIRYYAPTEGERVYHPGDTYCCPCNYRRIISELPEMIYYRAKSGVVVNLFTPSEARLDAGGTRVRLTQETGYPSDGSVQVQVEPAKPARFSVSLRIPAWAHGAHLSVNGQAAAVSNAGSFTQLDREWRPGDRIRLELPLTFRLVRGRQRQAGRVALMRGPAVFCLNPSSDKSLAALDGGDLGRYTLDPSSLEQIKSDSVRPGGVACRVGAWRPSHSLSARHELQLTLTEFPDPGGRATYFRLRDLAGAVDDELLGLGRR